MPLTDEQLIERMNTRMSPASKLLGARIEALDSKAGTVTVAYQIGEQFLNPMGAVQGGFVAAMMDEAAAIAAIAHAQRRIGLPTLEFKVSFLGPARPGRLVAHGRVVKFGSRTAFVEADLHDADGRMVARLSATAIPIDNDTPQLVERS